MYPFKYTCCSAEDSTLINILVGPEDISLNMCEHLIKEMYKL